MRSRKKINCIDPQWIINRYSQNCAGCGMYVKRGQDCFYYPISGRIYCHNPETNNLDQELLIAIDQAEKISCALKVSREYSAITHDENMISTGF